MTRALTVLVLFATAGLAERALPAATSGGDGPECHVVACAAAPSEATRNAVEAYLRDGVGVPLRTLELPAGEALAAPASGGVFGWFVGQVNLWLPSLSGHLATTGGDGLDFESDLGIDDTEAVVLPVIQLSLGRFGMRLSGFVAGFSGENRIDRTFTFGGLSFSVNEQVRSDVDVQNIRAVFLYSFFEIPMFRIAVEGGISYFHLEGVITGDSSGTAREVTDLPIPVLGLLAQAKFGRLLAELEVSGFTIDISDVEGTLIDVQFSVGMTLFKVVAVRAGYRLIVVDGTADDFDFDATLSGFFVGASVQF